MVVQDYNDGMYSRIRFIRHRFIRHSGIFVTFSWPRHYLLSSPCILVRFIRHRFIRQSGIFVTFSNPLELNSIVFTPVYSSFILH